MSWFLVELFIVYFWAWQRYQTERLRSAKISLVFSTKTQFWEYSVNDPYRFLLSKWQLWSRSYWAPYIVKKVTTTIGDDDEALDCGLYCEEFNNCDFFVHSDSDCYMGTFRVLEKIGSDLVSSWGSRYFGPMFLVYKSKFKHFLFSFLISIWI